MHIINVANSVIVITGASSGIGRELALQYATRGVKYKYNKLD